MGVASMQIVAAPGNLRRAERPDNRPKPGLSVSIAASRGTVRGRRPKHNGGRFGAASLYPPGSFVYSRKTALAIEQDA